jgi:elongation factor P
MGRYANERCHPEPVEGRAERSLPAMIRQAHHDNALLSFTPSQAAAFKTRNDIFYKWPFLSLFPTLSILAPFYNPLIPNIKILNLLSHISNQIFSFAPQYIFMAKASDVKNGNVLRFNGELVQVEEFLHRTPGNLRAFYQARMRNVKSGKLVEYRFRTDEEVDIARVETSNYQYLYEDGDALVVMDNETYDQHNIPKTLFGPAVKFLKEGMNVIVAFESEEPIMGTIPGSAELEITYTEPAVKGDTSTGAQKNATVETGAEIRVPLFINIGDKVKVDTATGTYVERVKG